MRYCTECGAELKEGHAFCITCGNKVESHSNDHHYKHPTVTPISQSTNMSEEVQPKQQQKPFSLKAKIMLGSVAFFVIILFGVYQFLSSNFDPVKDLQAMDKAVASSDLDTFMSFINVDKDAFLDKASYFQYIKENEWEYAKSQYLEILEEEKANHPVFIQPIESVDGEYLFNVTKEPELLGLFHSYALEAIPSKLIASTTMDNTQVTFMDKNYTLQTDELVEIASVYPGDYTIAGQAVNDFGEFIHEEVISITPGIDYEETLEFPTETYSFSSDFPDATLFINGESTEKVLSEINELGPFPDQEVELHAEWKNPAGEVFTSEIVTPDQGYWGGLYFEFADAESIASGLESEVASSVTISDDAGDIVLGFRDAYETAVNEKDFILIAPYLKDGSKAYKELNTYIADLKDTSYHYDFTSNTVIDVTEKTDGTAEVTTQELFTFTNHLNEVTDYDREKIYTLEIVDDAYAITAIDYKETNRDKR